MSSIAPLQTDVNGNINMEKQSVEVLYTPREILSEEPLKSTHLINDFYHKLQEYEKSRIRLLRKITAKSQIAQGTRSSAPGSVWPINSAISVASPNHLSSLSIRRHISDSWKDEPLKIHERRINFNDTVCAWKSQEESKNQILCTQHIPANVRVRIVESLLQIRDEIVEIVTFLQAFGFGGQDFKWTPFCLKPYGITNIPPLRIPQAFRHFATLE